MVDERRRVGTDGMVDRISASGVDRAGGAAVVRGRTPSWGVVPVLAVVALALSAPAAPLASQILKGTLSDAENGRPIAEGAVRVHDARGDLLHTLTTNRAGEFFLRIEALDPRFFLVTEALGYESVRLPLGDLPSFSPSGMDVSISVPPAPLAAEGLTATVRAEPLLRKLVTSGYYERQRTNFGQFMVLDANERQRARVPTDYLKGLQGVRFMNWGGTRGEEPLLSRSNNSYGRRCYPSVWVDGALVRRSRVETAAQMDPDVPEVVTTIPFDRLVSPGQVQAIEVYASSAQIPAQYAGTEARCGVILIWTV